MQSNQDANNKHAIRGELDFICEGSAEALGERNTLIRRLPVGSNEVRERPEPLLWLEVQISLLEEPPLFTGAVVVVVVAGEDERACWCQF